MIHFIYHFIVDSFLTGTLEPTNDQLPRSVASQISWLERRTGSARSRVQTPLSPEFFRLLYAIAKIAFITARIIASLKFIFTYTIKTVTLTLYLHNCQFRLYSKILYLYLAINYNRIQAAFKLNSTTLEQMQSSSISFPLF